MSEKRTMLIEFPSALGSVIRQSEAEKIAIKKLDEWGYIINSKEELYYGAPFVLRDLGVNGSVYRYELVEV